MVKPSISKKIDALEKLSLTTSVSQFYKTMELIGDIKFNYYDYMTTHAIDCKRELRRLPCADYDLCCALLTMLLREDHFSNGSFERRLASGDVMPIVERMILLLKHMRNTDSTKLRMPSDSKYFPSRIICEKLAECGGSVMVHSLTGKPYKICAIAGSDSFLCDQLPIHPPYTYKVFDIIVELLIRQNGKAKKGLGRNARLGEPNCEDTTVVGAIGKFYAGKHDGDSVFDPVFVLVSVLDWAGIVHNRRGYIELTAQYRSLFSMK